MRSTSTTIYYSLFTQTINSINKDKNIYTRIFMTSKSATAYTDTHTQRSAIHAHFRVVVIQLHFEVRHKVVEFRHLLVCYIL